MRWRYDDFTFPFKYRGCQIGTVNFVLELVFETTVHIFGFEPKTVSRSFQLLSWSVIRKWIRKLSKSNSRLFKRFYSNAFIITMIMHEYNTYIVSIWKGVTCNTAPQELHDDNAMVVTRLGQRISVPSVSVLRTLCRIITRVNGKLKCRIETYRNVSQCDKDHSLYSIARISTVEWSELNLLEVIEIELKITFNLMVTFDHAVWQWDRSNDE